MRSLSAGALGWGDVGGAAPGASGAGPFDAAARERLKAVGITLIAMEREGDALRVHYRNDRYLAEAEAMGNAARALADILPAGVSRVTLVPRRDELATTAVTLARADLADLQTDLDGSWRSLARARIEDASAYPVPAAPGAYPRLSYGLGAYLGPTRSDPDNFAAEGGLRLGAHLALARGLTVNTELRQPLLVNRVEPLPNLPAAEGRDYPIVRTDAARYDDDTDPELRRLTADYVFRPGGNLYGRVSAGLFEQMYGGVSAELLWKPQSSRLGLGAEVTWARKRRPDDAFGFEEFETTTGFLSAYYELGDDYLVQVDAGRYLAGDLGATFSLDREFDNGFRIGAYATLTDMPTDAFGEGSFDKGIRFSVPASWLFGRPSRAEYATTWRPVTGDGGARVEQAARLYDRVRLSQPRELQEDWGRFWR